MGARATNQPVPTTNTGVTFQPLTTTEAFHRLRAQARGQIRLAPALAPPKPQLLPASLFILLFKGLQLIAVGFNLVLRFLDFLLEVIDLFSERCKRQFVLQGEQLRVVSGAQRLEVSDALHL